METRHAFVSFGRYLPRLVLVSTTVLLSACGGGGTGGGDGGNGSDDGGSMGDSGAYPCEIEAIVRDNCLQCHGNPLRFGAPIRLDRWSDMHVPSRSQPDRMVYEVSRARLDDPTRPMPPRGMPADQKATLAAWLDMGAPKRADGVRCD